MLFMKPPYRIPRNKPPMPSMGRVRAACLCLTVLFWTLTCTAGRCEDTILRSAHAAFLINFIQYTTWPPSKPATAPLRIGVYKNETVHSVLKNAENKSIQGHSLAISLVTNPATLPEFDVVYIADQDGPDIPASIWKELAARPELVVSDWEETTEHGGTIELTTQNGKVRFIINLLPSGQTGLTISSKLLRLATEVIR